MTPADLLEQLRLLDEPDQRRRLLDTSLASLPDVEAFLHLLKAEVERYWSRDPKVSLRFADALIHSARCVNQPRHVALGLMARGDSLRYLGRYRDSADELEEAAQLFVALGDEVGWARTCIGSLVTAHLLGRADDKLRDADRAHEILVRHGEWLRAAGLDLNAGVICMQLGGYIRARQLYGRALEFYRRAGEADPRLADTAEIRAAKATANKATLLTLLGRSRDALPLYEAAEQVFVRHGEDLSALRQQHNIARVYLGQGHYGRALRLLDDAYAGAEKAGLDDEAGWFALDLAECYVRLNRPHDALELAEQAVVRFERCGSPTEAAKARFYCALVHGRLGATQRALQQLNLAEHVFDETGMVSQSGIAALLRASLILATGNGPAARAEAERAGEIFDALGMSVHQAQARVVQARAALALSDPDHASALAEAALATARDQQVLWLAHEGHLVLARAGQQRGDFDRALRDYESAVSAIERVQSRLPTELRTEFLADKLDVYHSAIELALQRGRLDEAFDYLERSKSRALVDYLATHANVRIRSSAPTNQALLDELARLREEHNWAYDRLYGSGVSSNARTELEETETKKLRALVRHQERRVGRVLERLALQSADRLDAVGLGPFDRESTRPTLDDSSVLLEYYLHGDRAEVFVLSARGLDVASLPVKTTELLRCLRRWQLNLDLSAQAFAAGELLDRYEHNARSTLALLYDLLVRPLADRLGTAERLFIIPYGPLHSVPFHALHDGSRYLLERLEVSACPSSSVLKLCTQRPSHSARAALTVAWSDGGRLPFVVEEASMVSSILPGKSLIEHNATRLGVSESAPDYGVLHLAAHGEARLDNPTFAHIKLADGQLTTADVFNLDLNGALVTLSACESGRSMVASGDELIGLSRAFLYAGARTLIQSLWRVDDRSTANLMERFYRALGAGAPAGAALRQAQLDLLATHSTHPYVWAPFQLIGHSTKLSSA